MYKCDICNKEFNERKAYCGHRSGHARVKTNFLKHIGSYCKIEDKPITLHKPTPCKYCGKTFEKNNQLSGHIVSCWLNPKSKETRSKISIANSLRVHTDESKSKISESMKLAHAEGRAWNIGKSRWNNEKSYPEKFFTRVIENEFEDKNYSSEYNVGNYSIDFAWVDKKIAIEIDGDQHIRFQHQIDSDIRKDKLLTSEGWKVLRIRWKDMCNDAKTHIQIAKSFVH